MFMKFKNIFTLAIILLFTGIATSQQGLPVYTDYLTDNYYLIHPSMAGASNCGKVRLTGRQQWFGHEDAPRLVTLNANTRIGNSQSAVGGIVYVDKNGYHSQTGAYLTYAHHLMFSRSTVDLNMLSFGLSAGFIQYRLDETTFLDEGFDPLVFGTVQRSTNLNIDAGFSYHYLDFYTHVTVKNILKNDGVNANETGIYSFDTPRQYLVSAGYVISPFGSEWSFEPSLLFQYKDATEESSLDFNAKAYKDMDFGKIWGGLSYRNSFDGAQYLDGGGVTDQKLKQFSPILGVNYNEFMFAYNYTYQSNSVVFDNGGFHQITLGYDFNCRKEPYDCKCPGVN